MSSVVSDWLFANAATFPDRPAVSDRQVSWTFSELAHETDRLATGLVERGVSRSDRVAALLDDTARSVALIHAVRCIDAVLVPLNLRLTAAELADQLGAARVSLLVHDEDQLPLAGAAAGKLPVPPRLGPIDELEAASAGQTSRRVALREEVDLDAAATILFTSGSSGRAKGAVLTHGNHAASAEAWTSVIEPREGDRWLACLPLYHVAGLAMVMRSTLWGVALEIHDRFDVSRVADAIGAGATHVSLVVPQLRALLDGPLGRGAAVTLRAILLGGGPIPMALMSRVREVGVPVIATYGMTETASGIATRDAVMDDAQEPPGLRPLPGAEVRVQPGGDTVAVRGAMVFRGYLSAPHADGQDAQGASDAGPSVDGWFDTGDIGTVDAAGALTIIDRRTDLVVSGGENIYPAEVEAVLVSHPGVADAAVVGRPDPRWGSVPVAAILEVEGASTDDVTLAAYCRERLAAYKVPVAFHRLDDLPRSSTGKIQRAEVSAALSGESS